MVNCRLKIKIKKMKFIQINQIKNKKNETSSFWLIFDRFE